MNEFFTNSNSAEISCMKITNNAKINSKAIISLLATTIFAESHLNHPSEKPIKTNCWQHPDSERRLSSTSAPDQLAIYTAEIWMRFIYLEKEKDKPLFVSLSHWHSGWKPTPPTQLRIQWVLPMSDSFREVLLGQVSTVPTRRSTRTDVPPYRVSLIRRFHKHFS